MVACFSLVAFAQKDGDKKPTPPKGTPPVVTPAPTKPPPDPNKPKKPSSAMVIWKSDTGETA